MSIFRPNSRSDLNSTEAPDMFPLTLMSFGPHL